MYNYSQKSIAGVSCSFLLSNPCGAFSFFERFERQVNPMTEKQMMFCLEYLKDCNATRAYKAAYPHIKNDYVASAAGTRLLGNVKVKAYIEEQLEKIKSDKIADAQEVMEYLTSVLRGESSSEVVVVEGEGEGFSSARRVEKAPDEKERLKGIYKVIKAS